MTSPPAAATATAAVEAVAVLDASKATTTEAASSMDLSGTGNGGARVDEWQKCLDNAVRNGVTWLGVDRSIDGLTDESNSPPPSQHNR